MDGSSCHWIDLLWLPEHQRIDINQRDDESGKKDD